jgi:ferredoxin
MLTDIFSAIRPQLTIMDGIIAMQGEGPASGSLRRLGVILISQDAVAVDAIATKIMGLNPLDIYTTRYCDERGLGTGNLQNIEVVGERMEDVTVLDFRPPASATNLFLRRVPGFLSRFLLGQLSVKPQLIEHQCTGCFECEKACPVAAISISGETVKINHNICIRCMCCHEVCRFNAIMPKRSVVGSAIHFLVNTWKKLMMASH